MHGNDRTARQLQTVMILAHSTPLHSSTEASLGLLRLDLHICDLKKKIVVMGT